MNPNLKASIQGLFVGIHLANISPKVRPVGKKVAELQTELPVALNGVRALSSTLALKQTYNQIMACLNNAKRTNLVETIEELEELADSNALTAPYSEVFIDFLMLHILSDPSGHFDEDFLESDEWIQIEEATIDRGTEALNALLYLQEAIDDEVKVELDDFLNEFLLVEEDEFQDEYAIYEPLIDNRDLLDEPFATILKEGTEIASDSEIEDVFIPLCCFFKSNNEPEVTLLSMLKSDAVAVHSLPITTVFLTYYRKLESLPKSYYEWLV